MRIGIIGGGQLGMMLTEAAIQLGHTVYALDPNPDASIKYAGGTLLTYDYHDPQGILELDKVSDVICYEFENIDVSALHTIRHKLPQGTEALVISKDRILEKQFALSLGIPTPEFIKIDSYKDLQKAFYPSIIKTTRFGYDGKGQYVLNDKEDIDQLTINQPMILEQKIEFDQEVSVILSRDTYGDIVYYPLVINQHEQGILSVSMPWWDAPSSLKKEAFDYAKRIVETLDYVGTMAIEFFIKNNHVIFNEMAPRPHNSGHFTIEGTTVSQFKNMILAITNHHVISPEITKHSMMLNILGQHEEMLHQSNLEHVYIHDYFKKSKQHNRKIGHMTLLGSSEIELKQLATTLKGECDAKKTIY